LYHSKYNVYDISNDIDYAMNYDIIGKCSIAQAAAAAPLRRFLVSAALILLLLSCSALILFASVIDRDTILGPGAAPWTPKTQD
jgi:hypothetical protein